MPISKFMQLMVNLIYTMDRAGLISDEAKQNLTEGHLAQMWKNLYHDQYSDNAMWIVDRMLHVDRKVVDW